MESEDHVVSSDSDNDGDNSLFDKILNKMKTEFNKSLLENTNKDKSSENDIKEEIKTDDQNISNENIDDTVTSTENTNNISTVDETEAKQNEPEEIEIVDNVSSKTKKNKSDNKNSKSELENSLVKEENGQADVEKLIKSSRRSPRIKSYNPPPQSLKRSSRRISKDFGESVLQNAIARKEKSYNETVKPQRLSKRLKPTAKTLANIQMAQKNKKSSKNLIDVSNDIDKNVAEENNISDTAENSDNLENGKAEKSDTDAKEIIEENGISEGKENEEPVKEELNQVVNGTSESNQITEPIKRKRSSTQTELDSINIMPKPVQNLENNSTENETEKLERNMSSSTESGESSAERKIESKRSYRKRSRLDNASVAIESRRRSHRRIPSPIAAEQAEKKQPSQPENAVVSPIYIEPSICLCCEKPELYVSADSVQGTLYCTAIDNIDGRNIGCSVALTSNNIALRRPSTRVPFIILCDVHAQRFVRHNCCPRCGLFCSQGTFVQCIMGHYSHRDCQVILQSEENEPISVCPHCGTKSPKNDVKISMKCLKKPSFLPSQKLYYPSAKITLSNKSTSISEVSQNVQNILDIPLDMLDLNELEEIKTSIKDKTFNVDDLYDAAEMGDKKKLVEILSTDIDLSQSLDSRDGASVLHGAAAAGHEVITHLLTTAGAPLDALDAEQRTPLMVAVLNGRSSIVEYLIKAGADVNFKGPDGMTALHLAARTITSENTTETDETSSETQNKTSNNNIQIIETVLSASPSLLDQRDDGGWTALAWACELGRVLAAKKLLKHGADVCARDAENNVPLHWAACGGNTEIIQELLNRGSEVDLVNVNGDTPLHVAARQDYYGCVLTLLTRGASPDIVNLKGESPLDCCENPSICRDTISLNIKLQNIVGTKRKNPILYNDISNGKEQNPIQCVNYVDDEPRPTDFVYITENCITSDINIDRKITTLQFCRCEDKCGTHDCICSNISLRCWYDEEGKLSPEFNYLDPPMLFECNTLCSCNVTTCVNRVFQRGSLARYQLFRTPSKGWGLRTLRHLSRGAYVCEYVGELLNDLDADKRDDDSYLFDLDSREGETYCIDARHYGNIARFINHHCDPNLQPVRVFVNHHDLHFPRIAFFANRDIEADEELGFDYGEKFWIIKYKSFTCACGAKNCKYSESTIQATLDNYKRKVKEDEENALLESVQM